MSSSPARIAVLGTGAIAQVAHLPILTRMRGVEVVGVHDSDRSKARTIADRVGIDRVYRSTDELWADEEVDAVVICTPSRFHEEQVREGLQAGKYIFCEKPLALTAEGGRRVLETDGATSRLQVGMNQRFRPDASALKAFVSGGELGDVHYVRAGWLNHRVSQGRRTWRQQKSGAGGGALMDLGVQMLDLALWLIDYPEPERVVAHLRRPAAGEVEDSAALLLLLEGGRAVNLEVTWNLLAERERQFLNLFGSAGTGSLAPLRVFKDLDSGLMDVTPQITPGRENQYTASYRQELAHFAEAVRGERKMEGPAEQVTLMRIVEAAYQSAEDGGEVRL